MRIAIIAHLKHPIAEPFFGGLEMHTHLLADRLAANGHDVVLYAASGSSGVGFEETIAPTAGLDRTAPDRVDGVEHDAYAGIMGRIAEGSFDLIHCNALHWLPLRMAASLDVPMVCVLHTPPFDPLESAVVESPSVAYVAVSAALASQWPLCVSPSIIENGIDLDWFAFGPRASADPYAFWSGRVVPEKGLHLAIDAARAADMPLRIAGPMLDLAYWDVEIAPRLGKGVIYLGHLEHEELSAMLRGAVVLLVTPRWEEPFGLVVAEALASGTPVAGFARGALPSILDESCGALAGADDVDGLAAAIKTCLALDRAACRQRAEALFDADTMITKYEALYLAMIETQARRVAGPALMDDADAV